MLTVRLPRELEEKIERLASMENSTKSKIIKDAIEAYLKNKEKTPYELGKDLFGKLESAETDLSVSYKQKLKEKLRGKHSH